MPKADIEALQNLMQRVVYIISRKEYTANVLLHNVHQYKFIKCKKSITSSYIYIQNNELIPNVYKRKEKGCTFQFLGLQLPIRIKHLK